jgi:hypothetical protein
MLWLVAAAAAGAGAQVYFSAEWLSLLEASFRNFLAGVMRCLPLPAVLRFNTDRRLRLALQQQVRHVRPTAALLTSQCSSVGHTCAETYGICAYFMTSAATN